MKQKIRVLVVEDDPVALRAHASYVARVPGFTVVGQAQSAAEALRLLSHTPVDLLLLDLVLPDMPGLTLLRNLRGSGHTAGVIAVTSARELGLVRTAVAAGVTAYVLKPFTFAILRDRLVSYADYFHALEADGIAGQDEVDRILTTLRGTSRRALPKGLSPDSLESVVAFLKDNSGLSASEMSARLGMSRVAVRRYLEYLASSGLARRTTRYGSPGRPHVEYHWRA